MFGIFELSKVGLEYQMDPPFVVATMIFTLLDDIRVVQLYLLKRGSPMLLFRLYTTRVIWVYIRSVWYYTDTKGYLCDKL